MSRSPVGPTRSPSPFSDSSDTSRPRAIIRISPPEFQFYASRHHAGYISKLVVRNLLDNPVGFKFKTNAPMRYNVKPVLAVLQGHATVEVYVRSESEVESSDKFLIQSVSLGEEEADKMTSTRWKQIDRKRISENFINCVAMKGSRPRSSSTESLARRLTPGQASSDNMVMTEKRRKGRSGTLSTAGYASGHTSGGGPTRAYHYGQKKEEEKGFITKRLLIASFICIMIGLFLPLERLTFFSWIKDVVPITATRSVKMVSKTSNPTTVTTHTPHSTESFTPMLDSFVDAHDFVQVELPTAAQTETLQTDEIPLDVL